MPSTNCRKSLAGNGPRTIGELLRIGSRHDIDWQGVYRCGRGALISRAMERTTVLVRGRRYLQSGRAGFAEIHQYVSRVLVFGGFREENVAGDVARGLAFG